MATDVYQFHGNRNKAIDVPALVKRIDSLKIKQRNKKQGQRDMKIALSLLGNLVN
jgi:hypothetical protein